MRGSGGILPFHEIRNIYLPAVSACSRSVVGTVSVYYVFYIDIFHKIELLAFDLLRFVLRWKGESARLTSCKLSLLS